MCKKKLAYKRAIVLVTVLEDKDPHFHSDVEIIVSTSVKIIKNVPAFGKSVSTSVLLR